MSTETPQEPEQHQEPVQDNESVQPETAPLAQEAKTFGMLCHVTALAGLVVPFGNVIGPLIVWLIKKDQHEFVDDQGKESLNFQITAIIAVLVALFLSLVAIGIPILLAIIVYDVVMVIIASTQASQGVAYRYPIKIVLIK